MSDAYHELGERVFVVTEVVEVEPPEGESGGTWFRYTIEHGLSPIEGIRPGTLKSVRHHAEEFANNLNQRALYGHTGYATRKVQKK